MIDKKPEVLAPAGDRERLEAALRFGADAVYLGGKLFNMRAGTRSFTQEELAEAVKLTHQMGKRLYLTCNTLLNNEEADLLPRYLAEVHEMGVDAAIVSDIGVLMAAHRAVPELELHISTQAGVTNWLTATELHRLGAKRVVLARELPLTEIEELCRRIPRELEVEVFVHGAMCMSVSGRCLLSQYLTGRDANRGACTQPCRWKYALMEEKRPGQYYPVEEDGWYSTMEEVAVYLTLYEKLPGNFISKYDAENLGWDNRKGNLDKVAPGCSIGGNRFGNYEGLLPEAKGRKYTECDINYDGGYRNGERIVFSNDGLIFYTSDHYQTFTPVKVIVEETEKAGEGKKK